MALNLRKIGVLMGGLSSERDISLKSGKAVCKALLQSGVDAVGIDIKTENIRKNIQLIKTQKINCAFLALHGRFGEDGQIQGILEGLKIPYTGSGIFASRLAMDKIISRSIFKTYGINVPMFEVIEKSSYTRNWRLHKRLGRNLVVKPATHGSSIGLSIINNRKEDLNKALKKAFSYDGKVIIEEYIPGREVTVGILGNCSLPVVEIIPKKLFFDFEAKYQPGMTRYVVPAKLDRKVACRARRTALSCHMLLGCSGCSRVDMILNKQGIPYILEVNTIPGLTETSLLPKAANSCGIEFNELCLKLIKLAYEKKKD